MYLKNFERYFSALQWQIILKTAQIAHDLNLRAFAVGGIVRDAIVLENHPSPPLHKDLDLVFDGAENAGIKVAIALHELFPASKLQIHEKFQTAALIYQDADQDFEMDMATARREIYAYAGANPQVIETTLEDDLWRRDFTINALAIELDPQLGITGQVIDRFDGLKDLANKQVRAIRTGSFEEDPRRLFRAARFAVRLDFAIAPETYAEITATTSSGIHDAIGGARLKAELLYTLAEPRAGEMFALLQKLGALRCIHPELTLPTDMANLFKHQWRRSQYWLKLLNRLEIKTYSPLQLGLELLLSYLPYQISTQLDLGLTPEQNIRQQKLADLIVNLQNTTNLGLKKSNITQSLQKFDTPTLILAAIKCQPEYRRIVWQYLSQWQLVRSPLTGADLAQLGYAKGKQMGEILQSLRFAAIDCEIQTQEDAIAYLQIQK